jgi:hypothetical protein
MRIITKCESAKDTNYESIRMYELRIREYANTQNSNKNPLLTLLNAASLRLEIRIK